MGLIRELRKAKSEATAAVKVWKANNPRRDGETLAQYRRRCQDAMKTQFSQTYGSPDWSEWLKIIMEVLKMIIPLLITCVLFALMLALPASGQAADLQWSTLDDATVVAASSRCGGELVRPGAATSPPCKRPAPAWSAGNRSEMRVARSWQPDRSAVWEPRLPQRSRSGGRRGP